MTVGRTFNGTTDKVTITTATLLGASTNVIPGSNGSTVRRSHPQPLLLANGDLLIGYTTNEDFAAGSSSFYFRCVRSTDGGLTFGASVLISDANPGFEGSFCQMADGTVVCVYTKNAELGLRTSSDNGDTWSGETVLDASTASDCHPSICLHGSRISIAYRDGTSIVTIHADVTGSTIGAWGSPVTVATGADGSLDLAPDGELICIYSVSGGTKGKRSTDSGVGSTWGSEFTIVGTSGTDSSLLVDGDVIWCIYPTGGGHSGTYPSVTPGTRILTCKCSYDNGETWPTIGILHADTSYDSHRPNGIILSGQPVFFCTAIDGDTDFHINRVVPNTQFVANMRGELNARSINNLQKWTSYCWIKGYATNASGQNYLLSKSANPAAVIDRMFLAIRDDGSRNKVLWAQVGRATTATAYFTGNDAFDPAEWTFVAATFDDSRGAANRIQFFAGTTPDNLAQVAYNASDASHAEGSGTIRDDTAGSTIIGSRGTANDRTYSGDLGKVGLAGSVLTLTQLQNIMRDSRPAAPPLVSHWTLDGDADDDAANENDGAYTGTTASATEPPTFSANTYNETGTGTATAGGASTVGQVFTEAGIGGVVAGGSATSGLVCSFDASGGVILSGSATIDVVRLNTDPQREGPSVVVLLGGFISVTLDTDTEYQ